jgi:hypothetical protein
MHEENWRQFTLNRFRGNFKYLENWRNTFKFMTGSFIRDVPIQVECVYSDFLYHSYRCASIDLEELTTPSRDNIERRSNLSMKEFLEEYAIPGKPVILTDIVSHWPAYSKWTWEFFLNRSSTQEYRAEAVDMTFNNYYQYAIAAFEESPLYLFDKFAIDNDPSLANDFNVPEYFNQDLFSVLGDQRPDYRWIIIGPERSGSTFHVDPNATSAWNAVLQGSKKWILLPPGYAPPGVYPSKDGSEVTSPVSLAEWYLNHYHELADDPNVIEGVCKAGEIIYVPSNWWHSVMNLEDSIALTQNFVSDFNLMSVLKFLRFKPDQVSGFKGDCYPSLFEAFLDGLKRERPKAWGEVDSSQLEEKKSKWTELTANAGETSFSFGFTIDDEIEV